MAKVFGFLLEMFKMKKIWRKRIPLKEDGEGTLSLSIDSAKELSLGCFDTVELFVHLQQFFLFEVYANHAHHTGQPQDSEAGKHLGEIADVLQIDGETGLLFSAAAFGFGSIHFLL